LRAFTVIGARLRRYSASMKEHLHFVPPGLEFDPQLANELARLEVTSPTVNGEANPIIERRSPFNGYVRMLTPGGGILIYYKDQDCSLFLTILRAFTWIVATGMGGWLIFFVSSLSALQCLLAFAPLMLFKFLVVSRKIDVSHSVEIHPDGMIVDGRYFSADVIGDHWPQLQMKGDDINRLVLCGIYGTRWIEYATANRLDSNDRGPEVLAEDLELAMDQMWGRREAIFAAPPGR
jgi:hypothetical protein